jgi:hypothetical protein
MLESASGLGRRGLACAVLGWLAWRGGAGTLELSRELYRNPDTWSEAFALTIEQRFANTLAPWDEDEGLPRGSMHALVRAFAEHVPPHATVLAIGGSKKQLQALVPIPHLCFPRKVAAVRPDREPEAESYLLVYDVGQHARLQAAGKKVLASGPDWTLWH